MKWDFDVMRQNVIGTVDTVSASEIKVLLEVQAPQNMALNTGIPTRFPRINGYVLIPNEVGALVGMITSIGIEHSKYPARKGFKDFDLLELPFPLRKMYLVPVGTLSHQDDNTHESVYLLDRGVFNFPSVGDPVIIPTAEQEKAILEINDLQAVVHIGSAAQNNAIPIKVDPDKLFGRHLAVLGNTGSGKSCTVAGLIRWSLEAAERKRKDFEMPVNARFIILDPNGEYSRAFCDENDPFKDSVIKYEVHLPDIQNEDSEPFTIPAWFWNCNEWISYTRAAPGIQRPILIDALSAIKAGREIETTRLKPIYNAVSAYKRHIEVCISQIANYQRGSDFFSFRRTIENLKDDLNMWANSDLDDSGILDAFSSLEEKVDNLIESHTNERGFAQAFSASSLTPIVNELSILLELFPEDIIKTEIGPDVPIEFDLSRIGEYIQASALINV